MAFVKVVLDSSANSSVSALTAGHSTDVGRVKHQVFSNASKEPSLGQIGAKSCHLLCHEQPIP